MNTWKLSSFDLFSLNMTIKGAWVYKESPDFSKMKEALAGLQRLYPHLGGRYQETNKSLVWDEGSSEALPFSTCLLKNHTVDEMVANPKVWSFVKAYDLAAFKKGRIAPFSAILAELKDGAILYVQCAHAAMDGATFYSLVNQWAALYKGQAVEKMTVDQSLIPAPDALSEEETLRQVKQNGWQQVKGKQLVKMLWSLFRSNRIKSTHVMRVTQEEIAELKRESGVGTNAVLSAITMKVFSDHHGKRDRYRLLFVADLRDRIAGIGEGFFGNISQPVVAEGMFDPKMEVPMLASAIEESLKEALSSGKAEENVRLSQCSSYHSLPYFYFDASDMNSSDPGTIYINNQLKFKACELDWGFGRPAYVFPNELTDMVKFWQPVSGGPVEVIFGGLAGRIMDR